MNFIFFDEMIDTESVNKLIDKITSKNEDTIIYFKSEGGTSFAANSFIDFTYRYEKEIKFICPEFIMSNAFKIILFAKGEKIIKDSCFGVIHKSFIETTTNDLSQNDPRVKIQLKSLDIENENMLNILKKAGFSKDQINNYKKGNDVHIDSEELRKFIISIEDIHFKEFIK
jgi:ATP-dependent protease ClpP protease subunit